jgi:hypothetical protein
MKSWIIKTHYRGATDTQGARIIAKCNGRQKSIPYPYELSGEDVHRKAAHAWVEHHMSQNGWDSTERFKLKTHYKSDRWSFEIYT